MAIKIRNMNVGGGDGDPRSSEVELWCGRVREDAVVPAPSEETPRVWRKETAALQVPVWRTE